MDLISEKTQSITLFFMERMPIQARLTMADIATSKDPAERFEALVERLESAADSHISSAKSMSVSYYENDNAAPVAGTAAPRGRGMARLNDLRNNGYDTQFKSFGSANGNFGEFLMGVAATGRNPQSEAARSFADRYETSKKSLVGAINSQRKAVGLNSFEPDHAGSLVLPEFSPSIIQRDFDNDIWSRTDNYTVTGNRMAFPKSMDENRKNGKRAGGLQAYWTGEEFPMQSSRPGVDSVELKLNKLSVVVYVTEELLSDSSYALVEYVSKKVREELDFALGDAVFRGDGVAKPQGFLNASSLISVAAEGGQTANTIVGENIINMYQRRIANRTSDYVWLINQDVEAQLMQMELGSANAATLVYMPPTGLSQEGYGSLLGRPVIPTEFNSTLGAKGDIVLADLGKYLSISKGGITEDTSVHVEWLRDQVAYKFTVRVDGRCADDKAITPYQGTNTQSAFISLDSRA
jgi:HK97 family phage major capsid protein